MIDFEDCGHSLVDHDPRDPCVGAMYDYWRCNECGATATESHVEAERDEDGYVSQWLVVDWQPRDDEE